MTREIWTRTKKRRALMNVLGAIFLIIIMATALNVIIWTLGQQDKITQTIVEKQNEDLKKLNEDIEVSDISINNNNLNLTITNDGTSQATLKSLYLINETSKQQYKYDLNFPVDGRNATANIGQSNPLVTLNNNTDYTVRVVSESGNTVTAKIKPVPQVSFPMSLYVIPPTVTTLENVTLLFSVMNNLTDGDVLNGAITPTLTKTLSCNSGPTCEFTDFISPSPTIIQNGEVKLFKWVFKVTAPAETTMTFNASLTNSKEGNYVIETGRVEVVQEALRSSEVIISSSLLQKPEVYIFSPGPFGDSSDKGYWGVVIANPVNADMKVKMVAINVFSSDVDTDSPNFHQIIGNPCSITGILPTSGWDCPHDGIIRWQNLNSPITIRGNSSYTLLAKTVSGSISEVSPAFMISVSVFTDFGQFSRQGYASNMYNSATSVANVYLTDTEDPLVAILDTPTNHILGNMTVIGESPSERIRVAIADFDTSVLTQIDSGATLIINVPKGLKNVVIPGPGELPDGFSSASKKEYSDGTIQIRAVTDEAIGNLAAEAKIFYFDVDVSSTEDKKTYVMHTFLEGKVNTANVFPAGAFGTFAITVCPDSGC